MVFQTYALYPHMTVRQNMGFALRLARVPKAERDRKVERGRAHPAVGTLPRATPEGPVRRSAPACRHRPCDRAQPKVFLFDEPLSNLDAALRGQMRIETVAPARANSTRP